MRSIKSKILSILICLTPFAVMSALTKLFFPDTYLLAWMLRHWYLGIWAIAAAVAWFDAKWGYVLSFSYAASVVFGQVVGDLIRNHKISKITAEMTNQEITRMHGHPGFQLWMGAFAFAIILCGAFSVYRKVAPAGTSACAGAGRQGRRRGRPDGR